MPYQTTPYGGVTPGPGMQVPVYYPPPPRQPLFKPETKALFWKILFAFLVVGAMAWLLIVGMSAAAESIPGKAQSQQNMIPTVPATSPQPESVGQQIPNVGMETREVAPDPVADFDLNATMLQAESGVWEGATTDIAADRRERWTNADKAFALAAMTVPERAQQIKEQAVGLYVEAGRTMLTAGDSMGARQAYSRALGHAAGDSGLETFVRDELIRLESG